MNLGLLAGVLIDQGRAVNSIERRVYVVASVREVVVALGGGEGVASLASHLLLQRVHRTVLLCTVKL